MKNKLIIIAGPTAVGKTDLSINLAKKINGYRSKYMSKKSDN